MKVLKWIHDNSRVSLFIEPIGNREKLYGGQLVAFSKKYYNDLFEECELNIIAHD